MTSPTAPARVYVEVPRVGFAPAEQEIDWELDEDESWFFEAVKRAQQAETVKFNESDWERNSGRFSRFVGSSGGSGGGGAGLDDAVGPIGKQAQKNAEKWLVSKGITRESMLVNGRASLDRSPQAVAEGKVWYQEGHDIAAGMGEKYGISTDAACAAVAALSPRMQWDLNVRIADSIIAQTTAKEFTLTRAQVNARYRDNLALVEQGRSTRADANTTRRLQRRYIGTHTTADIPAEDLARLIQGPQTYPNKEKAIRVARGENPDTVLKGSKVRSFYDNLSRPQTSTEVTIDGRMIDALVGGGAFLSEQERGSVFGSPSRYAILRDVVRTISTERDFNQPHQAQAGIWIEQGPQR